MPGTKSRNPYHCVIVTAPTSACDPARALKDQRFLSADAPRLPLPTCDRADRCRCVYKHVGDRRAGPRRETDRRKTPANLPKQRRLGPGRRATDD